MEIILLIIIGILGIILSFFLSSVLLLWSCRIFKVAKANLKNSFLIMLLVIVLGVLASLVLVLLANIIKIEIISQLLDLVAGFLIFHFLLQKFYQTKLGKNIGIYIVLNIFVVIISLAIVIPIRYLVIQPFYMTGTSMMPTFQNRDYLLLKMFEKSYQRGDVVVFRYPKDLSQYFIKRIVGMPGEKVSFANGKVLINGQALDESKYLASGVTTESAVTSEFILGSDQYFVLGDKRDASLDSRQFGPIGKNLIVGKYWFTGLKANSQ